MSENANASPILVSQCFTPMCSACESGRGLWDSDGDRLNYCGARLDWTTVVDADADDAEREPREGELEPPDEPIALVKVTDRKRRKPPLGILPRKIFVQERAGEILNAMLRYVAEGLEVPLEWRSELDERLYEEDVWTKPRHAHTATSTGPEPWRIFQHDEQEGGDGEISIVSGDGVWIASMNLQRPAALDDARMIVDVVNEHLRAMHTLKEAIN